MKIVHTYLNKSSFVNKDSELFKKSGVVSEFEFSVTKKIYLPLIFIRQFFFLLAEGWKASVFINQFSGYHSFLPCLFARLTGKKSIIISGGTDCVSFPGIGYGNFYRPILRSFTKWSYQLCSQICPKHQSLWFTNYTYDTSEPSTQGISAWIKGLQKEVHIIHNGYDPLKWPLLDLPRKKKSFITISGAFEYPFQVQLKGIDLILKVAERLPECSFTIAGVPDWKKLDVRSANVTVLPPVKHEELYKLFNEHEYYMQLSMAEGFPNALCEAMLCGCTPIVTNVFSMPEITGKTGYILKHRSAEDLTTLLREVRVVESKTIRMTIENNYSMKTREEKLISVLKSL